MNKENFNQIAENFIAHYDEMNSDPHLEFFKWRSFQGFNSFRKDFWTIPVDEFPKRLKAAFKGTGIMIDTRTTCPAAGICKMAEYEPATVQRMFQDLYADDHGDLDLRLKRIWDFISKADALLKQYANGSWKYKQNINDVIAYLALFKPDENYLYKYKFASVMARALEYADAVHTGKDFSLKKYYAMCEDIRENLIIHKELMAEHTKRSQYTSCVQDNDHVLVYDFIYCALTYGLYKNVEFGRPIRRTGGTVKQKKILEKQAQIQSLQKEMETEEHNIIPVQSALEQIPNDDLTGKSVTHKKFGCGNVVVQQGTKIVITFDNTEGTKKFILPDAIAEKYISVEDTLIVNNMEKRYRLNKELANIQKKISLLESQISSLEKL